MPLDTLTLRVALAVVDLTLLMLFYFIAYRRTRSAYSAWWCVALSLFLLGNAAYLLDGTAYQQWANPTGSVALVAGAACIWAGARSLRTTVRPIWLTVGPAITAVAAVLDQPATNVWAGGSVYLFFMAALIGLGCRELLLLDRDFSRAHRPLALAAGSLSVFYAGRLIAFVLDGPEGAVFLTAFGSASATLISTVTLVVASFAMAELSYEQQTQDLRAAATMDGLTGLLNRSAFMDLAGAELRRLRRARTQSALILADLDHFKAINDDFGHATGDAALQAFADACSSVVRSTDLVGRYGGEEFILLLPGAAPETAREITAEISRRLRTSKRELIPRLPTVSYGIAPVFPGPVDFGAVVASADAALYRAKTLGRDRSVLATGPEDPAA